VLSTCQRRTRLSSPTDWTRSPGACSFRIGVALMAGIGWGPGLLGVGVITLAGQVSRKYFGLAVEPFWAVVALFFVLGGVWELLGLVGVRDALPALGLRQDSRAAANHGESGRGR
jgi:hypothetical protein